MITKKAQHLCGIGGARMRNSVSGPGRKATGVSREFTVPAPQPEGQSTATNSQSFTSNETPSCAAVLENSLSANKATNGCLSAHLNLVQMIFSMEALSIDLVHIFRARWPRREPINGNRAA